MFRLRPEDKFECLNSEIMHEMLFLSISSSNLCSCRYRNGTESKMKGQQYVAVLESELRWLLATEVRLSKLQGLYWEILRDLRLTCCWQVPKQS